MLLFTIPAHSPINAAEVDSTLLDGVNKRSEFYQLVAIDHLVFFSELHHKKRQNIHFFKRTEHHSLWSSSVIFLGSRRFFPRQLLESSMVFFWLPHCLLALPLPLVPRSGCFGGCFRPFPCPLLRGLLWLVWRPAKHFAQPRQEYCLRPMWCFVSAVAFCVVVQIHTFFIIRCLSEANLHSFGTWSVYSPSFQKIQSFHHQNHCFPKDSSSGVRNFVRIYNRSVRRVCLRD